MEATKLPNLLRDQEPMFPVTNYQGLRNLS